MYEWKTMNMNEIRDLDRALPVIFPIGLIESHGPHLPVDVDCQTSAHFARKVCENTGAILMPTIQYGFIGEMREYPGTVGLRSMTLAYVVRDLIDCLVRQGFKKIIFLSGHLVNVRGVVLGIEMSQENYPDLKAVYWNYWDFIQAPIRHADKVETEFALLCGVKADMDKAKDFVYENPWYQVYSRYPFNPESGGVSGASSKADINDRKEDYENAVRTLCEMVKTAIADKS